MKNATSYFLGLTIDQWARALAVMNRQPKTIREAFEVRREMIERWGGRWPPVDPVLLDVEPKRDLDAAIELFTFAPSWTE